MQIYYQAVPFLCEILNNGFYIILLWLWIGWVKPAVLFKVNSSSLLVTNNLLYWLRSVLVIGCYLNEFLSAWHSGVEYYQYAFINRATGPYWFHFWIGAILVDLCPPLLFTFRRFRNNFKATVIISLLPIIKFVILLYDFSGHKEWAMLYLPDIVSVLKNVVFYVPIIGIGYFISKTQNR